MPSGLQFDPDAGETRDRITLGRTTDARSTFAGSETGGELAIPFGRDNRVDFAGVTRESTSYATRGRGSPSETGAFFFPRAERKFINREIALNYAAH